MTAITDYATAARAVYDAFILAVAEYEQGTDETLPLRPFTLPTIPGMTAPSGFSKQAGEAVMLRPADKIAEDLAR